MTEENNNILVVDDHPVFRDGVSDILQTIYPTAIILKASTGEEALAQAKQHKEIDWVFLDFKLPDINAVDLLPQLDELNLLASVVIVSSEEQPEIVDKVLHAGANGYLSKVFEKEEFINCIQEIEQGNQYLHPSMLASLNYYRNNILSEQKHINDHLSRRQHEVLTLLSHGLSNCEIGESLSISESTVKSHISHIMSTFEADNRMHCVIEARRLGILE